MKSTDHDGQVVSDSDHIDVHIMINVGTSTTGTSFATQLVGKFCIPTTIYIFDPTTPYS